MLSRGVGLFPTEPPAVLRELTALAESLGYDNVWFGDSQNIWREASVTMAAAAVGTSRIIFGTGVTNAVTRHRSLLASTWATMFELTGGRVAMGIGAGDSSLRTMGLAPMTLNALENAVAEIRTLFAGGSVKEPNSGADYHLNYVDHPLHIPIYIAASAPKILRLAGRTADGVILLVGTAPEFVAAALRTVEEGARDAGRTLADLHLVLWTPTAINNDGSKARDLVRAHVARVVIRPLPAPIDSDLAKVVEGIRSSYDYYHHMDTEAAHADLVPDRLVDLFSLAGTPEECAKRIKTLQNTGIDQISIVPFVRPGESREGTIRLFAEISDGI